MMFLMGGFVKPSASMLATHNEHLLNVVPHRSKVDEFISSIGLHGGKVVEFLLSVGPTEAKLMSFL